MGENQVTKTIVPADQPLCHKKGLKSLKLPLVKLMPELERNRSSTWIYCLSFIQILSLMLPLHQSKCENSNIAIIICLLCPRLHNSQGHDFFTWSLRTLPTSGLCLGCSFRNLHNLFPHSFQVFAQIPVS
jgi:hypothetical protein